MARPKTAGQLARRHFISLASRDTLRDAEATMRLARVRTLPVLDEGRLLGLTEHRTLVRALLSDLRNLGDRLVGAGSAPRTLPEPSFGPEARISSDAPLAEAAARLCRLGTGCLVVVESREGAERLLGVLTESDLLRAALARDAS